MGLYWLLLFSLNVLCVTAGDPSLEWGPYRPILYFGLRPQTPDSLLIGLMWSQGESKSGILKSLRNTCEMGDGIEGYGWTIYDTRTGGRQIMHDSENRVDITTEFVKADDGKSWSARISGQPIAGAPSTIKTALVFHIALEKYHGSSSKSLSCAMDDSEFAKCSGHDTSLGQFELLMTVGDTTNVHDKAIHSSTVSEDQIWQAKGVFSNVLETTSQESLAHEAGNGNIHFLQVIFEGAFSMEIIYSPSQGAAVDPDTYKKRLEDLESSFPKRVDDAFPRDDGYHYTRHGDFVQEIISNLQGGLGFFHGDSKKDISYAPEYQETDLDFWTKAREAMDRATITMVEPMSLLSHTPSRSSYPRGFLWDEGFHLRTIMEWDFDFAVLVLQSWLNLMDEDGWIGREQILGKEARSKVPGEFQVQYPHYANPPMFESVLLPAFLAKITGASKYGGNPSKILASAAESKSILEKIYPLHARRYAWFRRTQSGNFTAGYARPEGTVDGHGFRWRGTTPGHCLTSGLDDYPRANPPHPGELHVDALAWVASSAKSLQKVAAYLGKEQEAEDYSKDYKSALHNLDTVHWNDHEASHCDTSIEANNEFRHVCHVGYVTLMPLFLGLLDANHPRLPAILDLVSDPSKMWSPHGIRSLSAQDSEYGTGADYWRGPIWINLNVLAVLHLSELGSADGPERERAQNLSLSLRDRLVNSVFSDWNDTGYLWEQYSDKNGRGQRSHPFTGWTAAIILLMGIAKKQEQSGTEDMERHTNVLLTSKIAPLWHTLLASVVGTNGKRN
ncbi:putative mannosyl-oligosaccharide glucosidase [Polyplosphaeria fusca]|uniref:Mannosyl-oligosaccharide glucosidase n=1 Tax=Polyplosphaeria fusca TaxID=682080 RepID=A0A9P4QY64_9PLEO|nr:putative mannosyl-oligosaccharide glucosidase [Polyplosphaeria fusca]